MKKRFYLFTITGLLGLLLSACTVGEQMSVSKGNIQVGQPISDAQALTGSIKGTMQKGKTYTIKDLVTINEGDTVLIEEGVHINVSPKSFILVKGVLLSLGTKANPVWITDPNIQKQDNPNVDIATDPAYSGVWCGIYCAPTCPLAVIKWTHIEFFGAKLSYEPLPGITSGNACTFSNPDGVCIFEDNWVYGSTIDDVSVNGGKANIMRNTFEKCGYVGGDVVSITGSSRVNVAYNLFMGESTVASKASSINTTTIQCEVATYNNTIINGGWRRATTGRAGSINYEQGARGLIYNNIMVNCKTGARLVKTPAPDVANIKMGYNYSYGEDLLVVNQIYPTGHITPPEPTDIPAPSTFLPTGYQIGDVYDGSSLVGKNDPQFVNYPLGNTFAQRTTLSYVGNFNFHLKSSSPAINKGYIGFSPFTDFPVDPMFGSSEITPPNRDMGAYPTDGSGNQH